MTAGAVGAETGEVGVGAGALDGGSGNDFDGVSYFQDEENCVFDKKWSNW